MTLFVKEREATGEEWRRKMRDASNQMARDLKRLAKASIPIVGDGAGDITTVLANARSALPAGGGVIRIAPGDYTLTAQPLAGPTVTWATDGVTINGGTPVLPGTVRMFGSGGGEFLYQPITAADDGATFRVQRDATHTGGTEGTTAQAGLFTTIAGASNTNWEWALLGQVQNHATGAQQNVGVYGQAWGYADGNLWAGCFEHSDFTTPGNPTHSKLGIEVGLFMQGPDDNGARVGVDVPLTGRLTGTTRATFGYGVRVNGGALIPAASNSIVRYGFSLVGIQYHYGFSTVGAEQLAGGAAFDMADGQAISFSRTQAARLTYEPSVNAVRLGVGSAVYAFGTNGLVAAGQGMSVAGKQVVGQQQAAIADATDAASAVTRVNAVLAALRAHGMIAS